MKPLWGIDLGGTKVEGVILDSLEPVNTISRIRIPTGAENGYRHIVGQVGQLVGQLSDDSGLRPSAIGIGGPGVLDPDTQTMKNCNTTALNGQPFQKDLEDVLGVPVVLANDANCFAVAETRLGAVRESLAADATVFGIIMGTGVGGGLVVNGKLIEGRHGIAGEWGHNFLDPSGGPCYCGMEGCVETIISGPALERFYASRSGEERKLPEILSRCEQGGDEAAAATIERLIHFFGKGVASLVNIVDPDAIVLGGGLGNIGLLYTKGVESVAGFIFNNSLKTRFLQPRLGDSAGVFGAALLVEGR